MMQEKTINTVAARDGVLQRKKNHRCCQACETYAQLGLSARRSSDRDLNELKVFLLCRTCALQQENFDDEQNMIVSIPRPFKLSKVDQILKRAASRRLDISSNNGNETINGTDTEVENNIHMVPTLASIALKNCVLRIAHCKERFTAEIARKLNKQERNSILKQVRESRRLSDWFSNQLTDWIWPPTVKEIIKFPTRSVKKDDLDILAFVLQHADVKTLDLSWNQIVPRLCGGLSHSIEIDTVPKVDLAWNALGASGIRQIANALQHSNQLTWLNLCSNHLGVEGMMVLGKMLRKNKSLKNLNVSFNEIQSEGARYLAEALMFDNRTLQVLNVRGNNIGEMGAKHFAKCLLRNRILKRLYVIDNHIGEAGAVAIAQVFNVSIPVLMRCIGGNQTNSDDKNAVLDDFELQVPDEDMNAINDTETKVQGE